MKFKFIIYLLFLFIYTCDNPISSPNELDCIIDYKGFYDDCGVCSGGATGHIGNSDKDCLNMCFGDATKDGCGTCDNDLSNDCTTQDCNGDLNGSAFWDDCGICVGGTTGLIENNTADDNCLVCDGTDDLRDLCGVCYGDNTSCSLGLITLPKFELTEMHLWNNSSCSGAPYYSFYNEICLEDMCYDYDLLFYKDFAGEYKFYQYNHYSQDYLLGDWTLSGELCMDYEYSCNSQDCLDNSGIPDVGTDGPSIGGDSWVEDSTIDLDECWSEIDFANSYYDCINNMELCQNNSLVLTKYDEENNFCYQARYDSIENNSTSSNFDDNDFIPFPILNSYLINNFKYNNFLK